LSYASTLLKRPFGLLQPRSALRLEAETLTRQAFPFSPSSPDAYETSLLHAQTTRQQAVRRSGRLRESPSIKALPHIPQGGRLGFSRQKTTFWAHPKAKYARIYTLRVVQLPHNEVIPK